MNKICLFGDFFTDGQYGRLPTTIIPSIFSKFEISLYIPYILDPKTTNHINSCSPSTKVIPWSDSHHEFSSYPFSVDDLKITSSDFYHLVYQHARLMRQVSDPSFSNELLSLYGSIQFWHDTLRLNKIEIAFSMHPPHFAYDYTFFLACKSLGIPLRCFSPISLLPERKYIFDLINKTPYDLSDFNPLDAIAINASTIKSEAKSFQSYPQISLSIMDTVKINAKKLLLSQMNQASPMRSQQLDYINTIINELKSSIAFSAPRLINAQRLERPCILITLHMQPEASTSPCGFISPDQRYMIIKLARLLPDYLIIVKEHPIQFLFLTPNRMHLFTPSTSFRPYNYYKSLVDIPNVAILPLSQPLSDVLNSHKIEALGTYSGSPAVTSLLNGIPAICFGASWYGAFKGCILFDQTIDRDTLMGLIDQATHYLSSQKDNEIGKSIETYISRVSVVWLSSQTDRNNSTTSSDTLIDQTIHAIQSATNTIF